MYEDSELFDDQLLQDYMNGFYGYGSYSGDFWFVGMEEGSTGRFDEICRRITGWSRRGRSELEDVVDYHNSIGISGLFEPSSRIQPTWGGLIKIILSAQGQDINRESVRRFQQSLLGRKEGNNCLLELLPLPSPSTGDWLYARHSRLPELVSRQTYMGYYARRRAQSIRERIESHKPKAVVFYSFNGQYRQWWSVIAGRPFTFDQENSVYVAQGDSTLFVISKHPTAFHVSNGYFREVGKMIAQRSQ